MGAAAAEYHAATHRPLVSTTLELQRLLRKDNEVFRGFEHVLVQPLPDLPAEDVELLVEAIPRAVGSAESEEVPPAGLHAKLFFAAKGARRQLWVGSANATGRGWEGRNFEVVAELSIARDVADAIWRNVRSFSGYFQDGSPRSKPASFLSSARVLRREREVGMEHFNSTNKSREYVSCRTLFSKPSHVMST